MQSSPMDCVYCPACLREMDLVITRDPPGWVIECRESEECGYEGEGDGEPPTLRNLLNGTFESGPTWRHVNLAEWTRHIAFYVAEWMNWRPDDG